MVVSWSQISIWFMLSGTGSKHCLAPDADDNDPMHTGMSAWLSLTKILDSFTMSPLV